MRKFATAAFLLIVMSLPGQTAGTRPDDPVVKRTLGFYGRVNHWADDRAELRKELRLMGRSGVDGYMIELAGWAETAVWKGDYLTRTEKEYRYLLRQCRRRGLWLFVSIVNDNMGLGKYGDPGIALEDIPDKAHELMEIVLKEGPDNVLVQPVAEVRTAAGARFEAECREALSGFLLVHNGGWGFPHSRPEGFFARAVHPPAADFPVPQDAFVISDHGSFIPKLTVDGTFTGDADPDKLSEWLRRMKKLRVPVAGYYAFQRKVTDETAIRTVGTVLREP
ncbi:MAG: hypothetical protein IK076_03495 [Bacteroidales bacterium]|nr:hypothetical protein [Bacteroidales bacterium]